MIGNGVVIDPTVLTDELDGLRARGVDTSGLRISANAHLIMPYHLLLDTAGEAQLGKLEIGTTRRGIGPCYADKAARLGIRVQDLLDEKILKKKIVAALEPKRLTLRPFAQATRARPAGDDRGVPDLRPPPRAAHRRHRASSSGTRSTTTRTSIFEGAQGALLDIDHGTYPFVTSSNPVAGAACIGAGVGPEGHRRGVGHHQGLRDARRRRARSRPSSTTTLGEEIRAARRRVRHDDRPPAAHRLARPRRAALRRAHQLADRARRSPSSTCSPASTRSRSARGYRGADGRGVRPLPVPPVGAAPRDAATTSSCPAGARTSASAAATPTCPEAARDYLDVRRGVHRRAGRRWSASGPGREQIIWTQRAATARDRWVPARDGRRAPPPRRGAAARAPATNADSMAAAAERDLERERRPPRSSRRPRARAAAPTRRGSGRRRRRRGWPARAPGPRRA